jgi:aminopeptidase N
MRTSKLFLPVLFVSFGCTSLPNPTGQAYQDVISNQLDLEPNSATKTVSGRQTIRIRRDAKSADRIVFSANGLIVSSARINGANAEIITSTETTAFIVPEAHKSARQLILIIDYQGRPHRGITFTNNAVFTDYFACNWMFCEQNSPGDKATFSLSLKLPDGYSSLSVGQARPVHNWSSSQSFSPYLFGFAAGRFDTVIVPHEGKELAFVNATGSPKPLAQLFGTTSAMVDFFEEKSGLPLPTPRYTQLLVEGDAAQEHATYSVIGTNTLNPILTNPQEDWVIAHELAHQWWGNSITCASFADFWLNEGITVFMVAAWKQKAHGSQAYDRELDLARRRWQVAKDAGWDRPLAFAGDYSSLRYRRAIQYSKGAIFMDHLRMQLGETAFWRGLKIYSRANAGRSVTSRDFQKAMERASGQNLDATFNTWVYDTPSPTLP